MPGPSEDGKGGTKSTPDSKASYIYYRLYTKDGPLESNNPIYSNDRFISRTTSRSVRPPHTAASMKNHLRKIEGFTAVESCTLYSSLSEQTPLEDSTRLSIRGTSGPGSSDLNPMALVVDTRAVKNRSQAASAVDTPKLIEWEHEPRYVYYLVYDEDGEVPSKTSFGENSPFLGRVDTLSVPPPHMVSSLKYRLLKSEEILGHDVQLFDDEGGESTMDDSVVLALVSDTFPGYKEDEPIAIAYESQSFGMTTGDDQYDPEVSTESVSGEYPGEIQARELHGTPSRLVRVKEVLYHFDLLQKSNEVYTLELAQLREKLDKMETHLQELGGKESLLDRLKRDLETSNEVAFLEGASPAQVQLLSEMASFTHKLKVTIDHEDQDSKGKFKTGDILYTDGILISLYYSDSTHYYQAMDASGNLAYALDNHVKLCWIKMIP